MITKSTSLKDLIKRINSYNEELKKYSKEPVIEGIEEFQEGCKVATIRALLAHKDIFYDELN